MPPRLHPVEGPGPDIGVGQPHRLDPRQVAVAGVGHAHAARLRILAHHLHDRPAAVTPARQRQRGRIDVGAARDTLDDGQQVARPLIAAQHQAGADRRQGEGPVPAARAVGIDDEGAPARRLGRFGVARQVVPQTAAAVEQQHRRTRPIVVGPDHGHVRFQHGPAGVERIHQPSLEVRDCEERGLAVSIYRYIYVAVRYI
ncbi:hypothetical protein D3C72_953370 [compost metagenome]